MKSSKHCITTDTIGKDLSTGPYLVYYCVDSPHRSKAALAEQPLFLIIAAVTTAFNYFSTAFFSPFLHCLLQALAVSAATLKTIASMDLLFAIKEVAIYCSFRIC